MADERVIRRLNAIIVLLLVVLAVLLLPVLPTLFGVAVAVGFLACFGAVAWALRPVARDLLLGGRQ